MFRRLSPAFFFLALAPGCSTQLISEEPKGGPGGQVVLPDKDAGSGQVCIETIPLVLHPRKVEVLILFDRSGSMGLTYGSATRFQAASEALVDLVSDYAATVQFGFAAFPAGNGCADTVAEGCCVMAPGVPVRGGNPGEVATALRSATPLGGNTPTALALELARQHFAGLAESEGERFVLLVTDGDPSCSLGGAIAASSATDGGSVPLACQDALESAEYLVAAGIQVPVVSVGLGPASGVVGDDTCLDRLSHAGNAAASPGKPGYFTLDQLPAIRGLMVRAIGGGEVPTCLVNSASANSGRSGLEVRLGDQVLKQGDPDGWTLDAKSGIPAVRLQGAACDAAMNLRAVTVTLASSGMCSGGAAM